jgi:UDP-N-acetylglucosamine--N-acetylmuramyl-(pentapeptide) pyrophosphoryl-undecaprenol N-acetylglucosamine transferase
MKHINKKKIIIATGGTGGHIFPAYSLAKNFIKSNYVVEIITDKRGLKYLDKDIVNDKNIKLILNNSATIFKKNIINLFFSVFVIFFSYIKSLVILYKTKPLIVFGMGGHASFPVCIAARTLKIPFIIYENNIQIGKSNRYLLPFAFKIFVSYQDLIGIKKKYNHKVIVTGNIIREEILNFKKKIQFDPTILNILVLGGSQAAKVFGELLPNVFEQCKKENVNIKIFQQCVDSQTKKLSQIYKNLNFNFDLFTFTHNISKYFSKTELAITRSGSSVTAELINCNIPFISIPYPHAADSHQDKNATYFEKKGYSLLVKETEINIKLFPLIKSFYKDKKLLDKIVERQKKHSDKEVFLKINEVIDKLANE